ncbi:hypothetical protein E5161_14405 [Cohnella pontilimi]|uniref:Uncharacterized protein n=1 Tax=Cohnella pontilimi TaxID=2564100 RepID=A0A4U0F860_9BACL|nr:hypothetical protein [Cohnella pontilimi]TJY40906.1 hypothetical protein E5161_14405 [Cohnella pontilimi]
MEIRFKKSFVLAGVIILLFVLWFSWMSISSHKTAKMEDKMQSLLASGLQIAAMDSPRVKVNNDGGFYGPDLNNSHAIQNVYPRVYASILEGLQDSASPFCKVENLRMETDYISKLTAYSTVRFVVFLGVTKTISVTASIKAPRYKEITGLAEVGG